MIKWPPDASPFFVLIKPKARQNGFLAWDENHKCYKIAIAAPPIDGRANEELIRFLKKELGKNVRIASGLRSRLKKIIVS